MNDFYKLSKGLNGTMFKKWDANKVEGNEDLYNVLTANKKKKLIPTVAKSEELINYLKRKSTNKTMMDSINTVRKIERSVRNPVAHCITYLNDDVIKEKTGMSAKEIFNKIKSLMVYADIKITEEDLLTYEKLNEEIKKYL